MPVLPHKCKDARQRSDVVLTCGLIQLWTVQMSVRRKSARVVMLVLSCVVLSVSAASIKNGTVPKNLVARVTPFLGDYQGEWSSSVAQDVSDGISRYKLDNPVLRLSLDATNRLRVQFYIDPASARLGDELDLLGFGCRSSVGDLLEFDMAKPPKQPTAEPYQVFAARLDFDWGNCPSRVYAVASNDLQLSLQVDPTSQQYVIRLQLLKRVQGDSKIVVEDRGVQRVVKVRPKASDPGSMYDPKMEYCVLNELGEIEQCFDRETELKRYIVPFPFPGFSALWYTKNSPNLKVIPGVKKTYHEAVFHRPIDAPETPR